MPALVRAGVLRGVRPLHVPSRGWDRGEVVQRRVARGERKGSVFGPILRGIHEPPLLGLC